MLFTFLADFAFNCALWDAQSCFKLCNFIADVFGLFFGLDDAVCSPISLRGLHGTAVFVVRINYANMKVTS